MRVKLMLIAIAGLVLNACNPKEKTTEENKLDMNNPFFTEYNTPFGVPPFDLIKIEHYMPAFEEGFKQQNAEIENITSNTEEASFENTIEAYENSGRLLERVAKVFYNLNSSTTNEEMQKIAQELAPRMSEHSDNISLNEKLFERVKTVWNNKENLDLRVDQMKLLDDTYKSFVRGGANLNEEDKNTLRELNKQLSSLTVAFGQNVLAETNGFKLVIDNEEDLEGLPETLIEDAKTEDGKWEFSLNNPSVMPFLQFAKNRELRHQIWDALQKRGNNDNDFDNKDSLIKTANLRNQRARLLGYENHAAYVLEEAMAKTPQNAYDLLNKLWTPAINMAKKDAEEMQKLLSNDIEGAILEPWDWRYYEAKLRAKKFNINENEMRPYFELNNVKEGVFYTLRKLYNLEFKRNNEIPIYHPDVEAYEVSREGNLVGIVFMDFFPRESKRGGAWMSSFRAQERINGEMITPIITTVYNFSKATESTPALLTYDETSTLFHEMGHAVHGLLSNVTYRSQSGTSVSRDFVELPSQIHENWASETEVLNVYAKHYKTGEVIPQSLIDKMEESSKFGQGFATTEYLAASFLDLEYHTQSQDITVGANEFEEALVNKIGLISSIIPRYRSTYFSHIFSGGYSAGYYSYIWAEELDADAFDYFKQNGIFNPEISKAFEGLLSKGGSENSAELYRKFRGQDPSVEPLIKRRGLE